MNLIIIRLKCWLVLLFLIISYSLSATNYFLSNSAGNDASDGKTIATAWKSISKVNSKVFSTGDSIFLKRGDVWRELLTVTTSGTSASYIYYGRFGTGDNPKILGSEVATSWIDQGGNVWKSANTFINPANVGEYGTEIFFENNDGSVSWGRYSTTLSGVYNWNWSSNYIYVYSTENPSTKFKSVEIPQRSSIIGLNDKNYIHIDGIDLYYCGMSGVTYSAYPMIKLTGLIIENCKIAYVSTKNSEAGYGIDATYCDMIVRHCEIHDCGRRSISHHLYGNYTATNILIEDNYFHDGWHTTGPDFSVGASGTTGSIDGVIVRRNKFYDPPNTSAFSEHIFLQNYLYSSLQSQVKNVYIYSNIFISPSANSINMEGTQSVFIYNNVFYNHNISGKAAHIWIDNNNSSVKVKNNIFYSTSTSDIGGTELFMRTGQNLANVDANYNLYYRVNSTFRIIDKEGIGSFNMTQIALVRSQLGLEKNSPVPANPLFLSSTDYHVQGGSPAIASGLAIDAVVSDFEGKAFSNPPNIGCYAIPVGTAELTYISSSVENASPSVLEISFSSFLAVPAPPASAFTVLVNGIARIVSLVSISGTKVQLTLPGPVVYNDVITVAYAKPATNPLLSTSGQQAASFAAKTVSNNVSLVVVSIPVYFSSSVDNSNPSILAMTYDNTLVSPAPASSAFYVTVNSVQRPVSLVTIAGSRVLLTLVTPVAKGDVIKVSYTKPSLNPLRTASGGQAVSISAMPVSNNVGTVNIPPVIKINYKKNVFSGFIERLDASGTTDQNNDNLTFYWIVPSTVSVSSRSSSVLSFLAPIVKAPETFEFTLNVSDGKSVQSVSVEVLIQPYQPELGVLPVMSMESDGYIESDNPANVLDGNQGTWWSSQGEDHWLVTSLSYPSLITYVLLSFPESPVDSYHFDIYASTDDISWDPVLINAVSCAFSGDYQVFEFPLAQRETPYSYVKLLVHGNAGSDMNYVSEFRTFGIQQIPDEAKGIKMTLFPNPANNYFRLLLSEEPPVPYLIKIINMNGVVVYEKTVETTETYIYLPVSLRSGAYIVELFSGKTLVVKNRLIIHELRSK